MTRHKKQQEDMPKEAKKEESTASKQEETPAAEENIDWKERFLRVNADLQNYKRRVDKEQGQWARHVQREIISVFLPCLDELELALTSTKQYKGEGDMKAWLEGFILMQKNLAKRLTDIGVVEIDCTGQFDPTHHEALIQVDSPDHESGDIVAVLTKGYLFKDEVLRHAKVSVAK